MQKFQPFLHMAQAKALLRLVAAFAIVGNHDVEPPRFRTAGDGDLRSLAMAAGIGYALLHNAVDDFLFIFPQLLRPAQLHQLNFHTG